MLKGLSLEDEINNYEGRNNEERIALLKSVNLNIIKASDRLAGHPAIYRMRANLHTRDGKLDKGEDFDDKFEELKSSLKQGQGYIATDSFDDPIGYISWQYHDKDHKYVSDAIFISELYVLPAYRNAGVGKKLVECVLEDPAVTDYTVWLTHDPEELGLTYFYERFGFSKKGTTDAGNVIMIKSDI
jgi:GNAT superfamily N-acetyltransferase